MLKYCQSTWLYAHKDTALAVMQGLLSAYHIRKWKSVEDMVVGECCKDVKVQMKYSLHGKDYDKQITIRVICETEPYAPSKDGEWGINPVSILKEI